ncbi:MAG: hypothetical protein IJS40_03045, partial [Synergistaceae bacterium]|nr:hypothetical protein [Synergistaceae bacterium]
KRLGTIAARTFVTYLPFYVVAAALAGACAYFVKTMGWFNVALPSGQAVNLATMEGYNPLVTVVNAIHTELCQAAMDAVRENANASFLELERAVRAAVKKRASEKIILFGSDGKA